MSERKKEISPKQKKMFIVEKMATNRVLVNYSDLVEHYPRILTEKIYSYKHIKIVGLR